MPRFSVCIPNFNYAHFVGRTIQSVLDQTYQDFEIVVVDNASTDDSVAVIEAIQSDKIKLHVNRYNVGFAPNLQKATEPATGDYIILLSSDDLMLPHALETYAKLIDRYAPNGEEIILHSAGQIVNQDDKLVGMQHKPRGLKNTRNFSLSDYNQDPRPDEPELQDSRVVLTTALRESINPLTFLSTCYSRSLWQAVEGYDPRFHMSPDYGFLVKILSRLPAMVYSHEPLFAYRVHDSNQTAQSRKLGALKEQIDYYVHSFSVPDDSLELVGMSRTDLIVSVLENRFHRIALRTMADGKWLDGLRILLYSVAIYPNHVGRSRYLLPVIGALLLGPLTAPAGRLVRRVRRALGLHTQTRADR